MSHRLLLKTFPDLISLAEARPDFFPALLASEATNPATGRYSILFAAPSDCVVAQTLAQLADWFAALDTPLQTASLAKADYDLTGNHLPFEYGWFFYQAYESMAAWESRLAHLRPPPGQPLALAFQCDGAVVIDHQQNQAWITARSDNMLETIAQAVQVDLPPGETRLPDFQLRVEAPEQFEAQVQAVRDYIAAGDVYQVNLARQWQLQATQTPSPAQLYRQLAWSNPAPFAGLLQWRDFSVISSSPERLVTAHHGQVETRPIAGTRPRSADVSADERLMAELIAHPKERAEHIMLLDLERNDLGKICQPGSVSVNELMAIESYAHVHHIVSNVRGTLLPNVSFAPLMQAVFPGGTITGCPKIRCMEIIDELEQRPRGAYTGSMGYINHTGAMDSNILIRTLVRHGQQLQFMAGAGIVIDSDPKREVAETGHKAEGLLRALGLVADAGGAVS